MNSNWKDVLQIDKEYYKFKLKFKNCWKNNLNLNLKKQIDDFKNENLNLKILIEKIENN